LVLNPDKINIVMLHGQEATYQGKDKTEIIQIPALANKFIDYLALGHIHTHKVGHIDRRGAYCYAGCLEGRGYDECGEKGFVLLNLENKRITPTFVPFAKRTIHEIVIDISGLDSTSKIDHKMSKELSIIPSKDMLKVILTGKVPLSAERDLSFLETKYKDAFYAFKIEDDLVRLQLNPKDYEKDASLKGEFIRLLMEKKIGEEKESAIIELGLKALAGEEVDK
jgi:DNA repair exonuclease SbcCD nuclease subunit